MEESLAGALEKDKLDKLSKAGNAEPRFKIPEHTADFAMLAKETLPFNRAKCSFK